MVEIIYENPDGTVAVNTYRGGIGLVGVSTYASMESFVLEASGVQHNGDPDSLGIDISTEETI